MGTIDGEGPDVTPEAEGEDRTRAKAKSSRVGEDHAELARIGPYRLVRQVGEGGFGAVYLAEQEKPVRRQVALKIIKLGMDTNEVIARFELERQALAVMDHPNIAKVLDAGATEKGRPYFVMEFVDGLPITEFCDQHELALRQRLELFVTACDAVHHAHQRGLIHRDIKPGNILVAMIDGKPALKIIDFGIAKAIAKAPGDRATLTELGQFIGTPTYMSPEQAEGSADIDTRADVYSLGVVLYELLTGSPPFDPKSLHHAAVDEMLRIIREEEPTRPSLHVSRTGDATTDVAKRRRVEPRKLRSLLEGDLDWIVLRAIEKDRARRYDSANGLAMDIGRHLDGRAVVAAPPSVSYRLGKFVRHHRIAVSAAALVVLALVLGLVGTTIGLSRARREAERAVKAEAETKARADELQTVSEFQAGMLEQVDPTKAGEALTEDVMTRYAAALEKAGIPERARAPQSAEFAAQWGRVNATDTALELIDRSILRPAIEAIDERFEDQPLIDARLRQAVANRYFDLGLYDAAAPLHERALATRRRLLGEDHRDTIDSLHDWSGLLGAQGKLEEAEKVSRDAVARARRVLGDDHPDTLAYLTDLGMLLVFQGKSADAEPLEREALERSRRVLGEEDPATLNRLGIVAGILRAMGRLEDAETLHRESLEKCRRVLGDDHVTTLYAMNSLAVVLMMQQEREEAEPLCHEVLERGRRVLGEEHPDVLVWINNMGSLLKDQGRLGEAEPFYREAAEKYRRKLGLEHQNTLFVLVSLAGLLREEGKLAEAEPIYGELLATRRRMHGDDHPETLKTVIEWGRLREAQGRHGDAIAALAPAEGRVRAAFTGADVTRLALLLTQLGKARTALSKSSVDFSLAERNLLEAHGIYAAGANVKPATVKACTHALVDLYRAWDEAAPGAGHAAQSAEWTAKLAAFTPPAQPRGNP